ncbi:MAG: hypothetical protein QM690_04455 [Sphingobium sp.]
MARTGIVLLAAFGLAYGAAAAEKAPTDGVRRLTPKQAQALAKALDGKEAGKPVGCVPINAGSSGGLTPISDEILIYRVSRDLVYRNDLNGRCSGIANGSTLVLQPTTGQYCRNDIAHVVDLTTGMRGPSCALGDFIPYRTPGK